MGFSPEALAVDILERHGIDPRDPKPGIQLAYCIIGGDPVHFDPCLRVPSKWNPRTRQIQIRPDLPPRMENYCFGHEVAHYLLQHDQLYWPEFIEREADALAASLLVPAPALRWAVRTHGRVLPELADVFTLSESILHLRLGEVLGSPLALVTPRRVHVRGDIEWGSEDVLRARAWGRQPTEPWFELVRFTDTARNRGLVLRAA